jgi:hypothetical protein
MAPRYCNLCPKSIIRFILILQLVTPACNIILFEDVQHTSVVYNQRAALVLRLWVARQPLVVWSTSSSSSEDNYKYKVVLPPLLYAKTCAFSSSSNSSFPAPAATARE